MTDSTALTSSTASEDRRATLFTAAFVRLAAADLAYFTAAGVAIYALPLYVTGPVGSDKAGAGVAFGAFAASALVLRPYAGRLADRWGRSPLLVGGALLAAVLMALTSMAESLAMLVLLRLALGVAEAAFFVASFAAVADLAPPSRMGEALSYNSLGLYLGLTLGPPLGELLVSSLGFTGAWSGAGVLLLLAAWTAHTVGETRDPRSASAERPRGLVHWPAVPVAAGFLTSVVAMGGFLTFASLHAGAVGLTRTSLPLAVYGLVVVTCRVAFAKVPDRLPALPLGAAALGTITLGLLVVALWATQAGLLLGTVLVGVGVAFSTPAFFTAIFATAGPARRGAASGTASAFLDLGLGGGPIVLGLVAESSGVAGAFLVAAAIAVAGAAWTVSLSRDGRRPALLFPSSTSHP